MRARVKTPSPNTSKQQAHRRNVAKLQGWFNRRLSESAKARWEAYAAAYGTSRPRVPAKHRSARSAFLGVNLPRLAAGYTVRSTPPTGTPCDLTPPDNALCYSAPNALVILQTPAPAWWTVTGAFARVQASPPQPAHTKIRTSRLTTVGFIRGSAINDPDVLITNITLPWNVPTTYTVTVRIVVFSPVGHVGPARIVQAAAL